MRSEFRNKSTSEGAGIMADPFWDTRQTGNRVLNWYLSIAAIRTVDEDEDKNEKGDRTGLLTIGRRMNMMLDALSMPTYLACNSPTLPKVGTTRFPVRTPTCGIEEEHNDDIKATWLGNACFLVKLPFVASLWRGARVLAPKRCTDPPCKIGDILEVNAVVISRMKKKIDILGMGSRVLFDPVIDTQPEDYVIVVNPHFTSRGLLDQGKTFWANWAVEAEDRKVYFTCDTECRSVKDGEGKLQRRWALRSRICPYKPRWFVLAIHCARRDSVRIIKGIRAKNAITMHRGTWWMVDKMYEA
ncbi:hypothetical protein ARMSODRAFT_975844 [Armillaria solidipes]|uniref:Uncharacterized protein n=1 Tax=Armillaria solidipes TaxID=1076256 RepID=A0A2H3BV43_9AGAR|nr:hypothetical protein ARMSODRAFT_975844 [Armillaria solidipes]